MAHILNATYENRTLQQVQKDEQGVEHAVETVAKVLSSVTFMKDEQTPHTLTFLAKGTKIIAGNGAERVVGDVQTVYHEFTDAETAVQAYLDGKV